MDAESLFSNADSLSQQAEIPTPGLQNRHGPVKPGHDVCQHFGPLVLDDPLIASADQYRTLAVASQKAGRRQEAEQFYRAALTLEPENPDIWANLGLAVLNGGRPEEAVVCEREALRLQPDNVEALNNIGIAMHAMNALSEAENHFRGALRLSPDHANATLNPNFARFFVQLLELASFGPKT